MKCKLTLINELSGSWMGGIDDRHLICFGNMIDCIHQRHEICFIIYVFFPMCRNQNIVSGSQIQLLQHRARIDLVHMLMEHFRHRASGHKNGFSVNSF